jgi:mannose-6-phosphate isomerase-like protein (cupin superfamily)
MDIRHIKTMEGGWFVGNFEPAAFQTADCEVGYLRHRQGEEWPRHYHKKSVEVNYLIRGRMRIQDRELQAGDVFVLHPFELADPVFHEDCELIVVKIPSRPGDKHVVS